MPMSLEKRPKRPLNIQGTCSDRRSFGRCAGKGLSTGMRLSATSFIEKGHTHRRWRVGASKGIRSEEGCKCTNSSGFESATGQSLEKSLASTVKAQNHAGGRKRALQTAAAKFSVLPRSSEPKERQVISGAATMRKNARRSRFMV